jgi:hypothetical protein
MTNVIVPEGATNDVCLTQDVLTNGFMVFSGTNGGNFIANGYMRTLSFTSANDISGMAFIVTGIQNGVSVTENVTGGTGTFGVMTVYSVNYYERIISIQASGAALAVSIGSGSTTRIFYNASLNFSSSRAYDPYIKISIDNPSAGASNTTTRVDGLNGFPDGMSGWEPDNEVAITRGTRSIKVEDRLTQWELNKADVELYSGFIITVEGFPTDSVFVNIIQP